MENQKKDSPVNPVKPASEGINNWNDRLDENLEPEARNNPEADEKAKDYSQQQGSGDQSDAASD